MFTPLRVLHWVTRALLPPSDQNMFKFYSDKKLTVNHDNSIGFCRIVNPHICLTYPDFLPLLIQYRSTDNCECHQKRQDSFVKIILCVVIFWNSANLSNWIRCSDSLLYNLESSNLLLLADNAVLICRFICWITLMSAVLWSWQ